MVCREYDVAWTNDPQPDRNPICFFLRRKRVKINVFIFQSLADGDTVAVDQIAILEGIPSDVVTRVVRIVDREFSKYIES